MKMLTDLDCMYIYIDGEAFLLFSSGLNLDEEVDYKCLQADSRVREQERILFDSEVLCLCLCVRVCLCVCV